VDKQVAALVEIIGSDATTMVFSLHGMRSSAGVPAFLQPLLCESGFARLAEWKVQSWTERALSILSAGKRHTPESVKKLYYKTLPRSATHQLARPTMMPIYDWSHTRAFSLPTDQHGWIRINLQGREAEGVVSHEEYDDMCRQVEDLLWGLTMEDGRRLVRRVTRTAANFEEASSLRLPDIVVHWEDASFRSPTRIKGSAVEVKMIGRKFTGQHAPDGFCILKGGNDLYENDVLAAKDMHILITKSLQTAGYEKAATASA
jgi:predicted AlkP superfamily phosphohydrolase/phosphomutase